MFHRSSLVALVLGLIAAASSLRSPRESFKSSAGLRIPLHKRHGLKVRNDVFDFEMAAREVTKLKNKHRHNLENIKKNKGHSTFANGAYIKPTATPPVAKRDTTGSVLLTTHDDKYWLGSITIGDPGQRVTVNFDTASGDTWVQGPSCQNCSDHHVRYDPSMSTQSKVQPGVFNLTYGDNWNTSGTPYTDTVTIGGIRVTNQSFLAVTQESFPHFGNQPFDGVIGMGLPATSTLGQDPFMQTAVKQQAVANGTFAFKLRDEEAELFLGGTNQDLYTGDIEYHDILQDSGFWAIGPANVQVNEQPVTLVTNITTIIDSGLTPIIAPPAAAAAFYSLIEDSQAIGGGYFSYPCYVSPEVAFNWGGKSWNMMIDTFNLGRVEKDSTRCVGAVVGMDYNLTADSAPVWTLGERFMKNVYTVFSVDTNSLGFAELR